MVKETISKILAYVEKNCTEVEEVEEYLWELLDEQENKDRKETCERCKKEVGIENLTGGGLCEDCEYEGEYTES